MMGFMMKFFGESGIVEFEAITNENLKWTGKAEIEFYGCDENDIISYLKKMMYFKKGVNVKTLNITGFYNN